MLRVLTSNRAVSLQNVASDIVKVATAVGVEAAWYDRPFTSFELRKAGDSALVVMAVDPLIATPWFLLCRDYNRGGVRNLFYATVEGGLNRRFVHPWMREVRFVANSEYTRSKLAEAGLPVVGVVPHGVDLELVSRARSSRRLGAEYLAKLGADPSKHVVVLTVSNAHPRKGLAWYDQVVEEVGRRDGSVRFVVVTEEKGLGYFRRRPNLVVSADFGKLPRVTVLAAMAAAHVVAVPSLAEGFGLPVLEAMALGTPVVHAELPPLMEFSEGFKVPVKEVHYFDRTEVGPSGIVYEHHLWDPKEFAEVLLQVVDHYRSRRDAIVDYRVRACEKAVRYSVYAVYTKLLRMMGFTFGEIPFPAPSVAELDRVPEVPPPAPPVVVEEEEKGREIEELVPEGVE